MISLNVILTLMIIVRLALHTRNNRGALGAPGGIAGVYKAVITMLIESCALYTVGSVLVVMQLGAIPAMDYLPILYQIQVRNSP